MNKSQVSSFPCIVQRNLCILNSRFCDSLNLFSSAVIAPSKSVPVSSSCSNISSVASPTESRNNKTPKVVSVGCVGLWKHNGVLSEAGKVRETGKMCHVMSIDE